MGSRRYVKRRHMARQARSVAVGAVSELSEPVVAELAQNADQASSLGASQRGDTSNGEGRNLLRPAVCDDRDRRVQLASVDADPDFQVVVVDLRSGGSCDGNVLFTLLSP